MYFIRLSDGITGDVHMCGVRDCYIAQRKWFSIFKLFMLERV